MKIGIKASITLKNQNLLEARIDKGFQNIIDLINYSNGTLNYNTYLAVENMKLFPGPKLAIRISKLLEKDVEELFPNIHKKHYKLFKTINKKKYLIAEAEKLISGERREETFLMDDLRNSIDKSLSCLDDRERKILELRFYQGLTHEECGKKFNISRCRAAQIENKAIRKLRHPINSNHLKEFIDLI